MHIQSSWTIFWDWLDANTWGKGAGASFPVEDNIEKIDYWDIRDRTNHSLKCGMYPDIPNIVRDILDNGAKLAIVSRSTSKGMCDRALLYRTIPDAQGNQRSLIEFVSFTTTNHFKNIKIRTNFDYSDMILYDDDAINSDVEMLLGVTFQVSRDQKGPTWDNYQNGLKMWRHNKDIRSPWLGPCIESYENKIYFKEWIKQNAFGPQAETVVCAIYARDRNIFYSLPKIWVPEDNQAMTNNQNGQEFDIAWSQEDRDRKVESWGVQKPYILFSRHHDMQGTVPVRGRFNEMVVYGQIQEGPILNVQMSNQQLADASAHREHHHLHHEQKFQEWNITVSKETWDDFCAHGEQF
ncbi:hypothetical protein L218DRAFT_992611 [Marasmius fiardii PR-910]|nr:hypothetical protein L218DRAFT_992611 [Marasmius fiardii PR-910]